jgi:predicted ATP-dependent endonuclease of OLD family
MLLSWTKAVVAILTEYYSDPLPIFHEEKDPQNYFSYSHFKVRSFRGLDEVDLDFAKNDMTLLLGLNESGKTTILKAIETFDFNNDPSPDKLKRFFTSMRNKQDIECSQPCVITAEIQFSEPLDYNFFKKVLKAASIDGNVKGEIEAFVSRVNVERKVTISRVIPFQNGSPGRSYYQIDGEVFNSPRLGRILAQEIVRRCPFILYFEDFKDSIPDRVYTKPQNPAYNASWYEIIDGLFYNTDPTYSIKKLEAYFAKANPREDDARSVLKKVNKTLQKTFTEKWVNLSGVKEIEQAEIDYNSAGKYFEIKITEQDGTTFSVHERSKGAVWYLAFLMKTEFRRKKLREGSGKPIYLIDEPASNLHSTAQQKMVQDFHTLVEDTTLVYTTHSRYLISLKNIKNTYVVRRTSGKVICTKWSEYIKGKDATASYYQPLFDALNIVPNNFDIPWEFAIITEGPSDALTLEIMEVVLEDKHSHAIYPGSSASNLSTLISLNIGWGAKFRILLDSDKTGLEQKEVYMKSLALVNDDFVLLPDANKKLEKMFSDAEKSALHELAFGHANDNVSKNEFLAVMRELHSSRNNKATAIAAILTKETKERFQAVLTALKA